jgi:hypothetical protein
MTSLRSLSPLFFFQCVVSASRSLQHPPDHQDVLSAATRYSIYLATIYMVHSSQLRLTGALNPNDAISVQITLTTWR